MGRWISESQYERRQFQPNSLKHLTCYEASHSKTLIFDLKPKGAKSFEAPQCEAPKFGQQGVGILSGTFEAPQFGKAPNGNQKKNKAKGILSGTKLQVPCIRWPNLGPHVYIDIELILWI